MDTEMEENNESKGSMWELEKKLDQPMDEEAGKLRNMHREKKFSAILLLRLAFQSLGVVFGDLGTSPLYVFYNTFPDPGGIKDTNDVIGALSLIIYSLTLIPLLKYVFIVCKANDAGQGGTFALYSLLCRHAKINTIPNQHRTDEDLTTYSRTTFQEHSSAAKVKKWLEANAFRKTALLILVLVGTCMVIGDGILTPAISGMCICFYLSEIYFLLSHNICSFSHFGVLQDKCSFSKIGNYTNYPYHLIKVIIMISFCIIIRLYPLVIYQLY
jgi:KUP system potassium uptake protein